MKHCDNCGALFAPPKGYPQSKTCSRECNRERANRRRAEHARSHDAPRQLDRIMDEVREGREALRQLDARVRRQRRPARAAGFFR